MSLVIVTNTVPCAVDLEVVCDESQREWMQAALDTLATIAGDDAVRLMELLTEAGLAQKVTEQ